MKLRVFILIVVLFILSSLEVFSKTYEISESADVKGVVIADFSDDLLIDVEYIPQNEITKTIEFERDFDTFKVYVIYDDRIEQVTVQQKQEEKQEEPQSDDIYKKSYPDIYEKEKDANRSLIIVNSVSYIFNVVPLVTVRSFWF